MSNRLRALAFAALALFSLQTLAVEYAYDPAGRLVGVVDNNGDAAQYVYDPAGNITEIKRFASTALSLIEFAPRSGATGTQVTIWGSGFSTTPSQNAVTFNGATATVSSATKNKLVVTVPSGATTGNIGITVSASSVTSASPFTVLAAVSCASRLTGLSPTIGVAASTTTVSGSAFDRGPNTTTLNSRSATNTATSTALTVTIPTSATSGRMMVSTAPVCPPASAGDFFVPPSPLTASDIGATGRLTQNASPTAGTLAANKKALYVFDGTFGQAVGVSLTSSTLGSVTVEMRAPDGSIVASANLSGTGGQITPTALPQNGGYTVYINPTTTTGGTYSIQVGGPDLVISGLSAGTITSSQNGTYSVPVSFTVTNLGAFTATASWYDYSYLTTQSILVVDAIVLGNTIRSTSLAPGASYTVSQTYTTTEASPGAQFLFVRADSRGYSQADGYGTLFETNENNNLARVAVTLPPYPDLAVSSSPTVGSITVNQNGTFNIPATFTVSNIGTTTALSSWSDWGYLASNGTLDSSSVVLGGTARTSSLAGGANYNVSQTYVTSGVSPGTYTLFVKADGQNSPGQTSAGVVKEGVETNNVASATVVLPQYPDLVMNTSSVGTITLAQNGTYTIPITFNVSNNGGSPAAPNWNDYVYLSPSGVIDSSTLVVGAAIRSTALAVNANYTVNQNFTTTAAPGTYTLFIKADGRNPATTAGILTESNESNNTTAGVSVQLPAYPDLVISSPSVGTITKTGSVWNIPITFTVTNSGGSPAQPSWTDTAYLSSNGVLDGSSTYLGASLRSSVLAAGASYTTTYTYVTPAVAAGNYTVFVRIDGKPTVAASGSVVEGSESNNTSAGMAVTLN